MDARTGALREEDFKVKKYFCVFFLVFTICGYMQATSVTEYQIYDRLFAHTFGSANTENKPLGDKSISDKALLDSLLNTFSTNNIDSNYPNELIREYYNFVTSIDKKVASGKCILNPGTNGNGDGIDSVCYYTVLDSNNSKYEIIIFDFFRKKIYKSDLSLNDGSFTKLLGNIDYAIKGSSEGKFPELMGEAPYGMYSLDLNRMFGHFDCLKFDKPIVDKKKKLSKKESDAVKLNFTLTNEWKNNCSDFSICIDMTTYGTYVFFTEDEIKYFQKNISTLISKFKETTVESPKTSQVKSDLVVSNDDIPIQMNKIDRPDTDAEISFMSFNRTSLDNDIKNYLQSNNINYKVYDNWKRSGSLESKIYTIEDIQYKGAKFSSVDIEISQGDGFWTSDQMDNITCYLLTEADFDTFVAYLKKAYPYSNKAKVFYGKSRLSSQFADYIYYDEISCDRQKCKITYNFSVRREHEIKITENDFKNYEPFSTSQEVQSVCNPSDGRYTSMIPIRDLNGQQYKFHSAVQIEENGKKVLYITLQNNLTWNTITVSAEYALRNFICNEQPFGKKK